MIDVNEAVERINTFFNSRKSQFGIKAVFGKNIVSDQLDNLYEDTLSSWILLPEITGTPLRKVIQNTVGAPYPYFGFEEDQNASGFGSTSNAQSGGFFPMLVAQKTVIRYEPIVTIRHVYTGKNAAMNAFMHFERMKVLLAKFTDMSMIGARKFHDASVFFEARYLNRYQADLMYLVFLDVERDEDYMSGVDEELRAYQDQKFTTLLTTRQIEVNNV